MVEAVVQVEFVTVFNLLNVCAPIDVTPILYIRLNQRREDNRRQGVAQMVIFYTISKVDLKQQCLYHITALE